MRGDGLADSTPRQIILRRMLGLPEPGYAHVPLVFGADGERHARGPLCGRRACSRRWVACSLGLAEEGEIVVAPDLLPRFDPRRRRASPWNPEI